MDRGAFERAVPTVFCSIPRSYVSNTSPVPCLHVFMMCALRVNTRKYYRDLGFSLCLRSTLNSVASSVGRGAEGGLLGAAVRRGAVDRGPCAAAVGAAHAVPLTRVIDHYV